jgi:hypothetical protein
MVKQKMQKRKDGKKSEEVQALELVQIVTSKNTCMFH